MHKEATFELFHELSNDTFDLIYLGEFDDELTAIFLDINEVSKAEIKSYKKKISFLIAECFQNIIRHSDDGSKKEIDIHIPRMFMLRDKGKIHHIVTSNLIENAQQENLSTSLDSLKNLTKSELKEIYLNALINNQHSEKGGAGLGLIEMARKSGNAPSFDFVKITDTYSNFFLQVNIAAKDYNGDNLEDETSVESAKGIYKRMKDEEIILVQKGDFSQDSIIPLIQLFENNLTLKEENLVIKKKALYVLIEMLQNITIHSSEEGVLKQAILIVRKSEGSEYGISTGNYISNEEGKILVEQLDSIADLDKIELTKRYKKQLSSRSATEGKGAGIGLIEICRNSSERIDYHIKEISDDTSFFSLNVKL